MVKHGATSLRSICVQFVLIVSAAGLLGPITSVAAQPIVVVQVLPMAGSLGTTGTRFQSGTRAYIERVNAEGSLGSGRSIELVTLDDGGDPILHATQLRKLIGERGAVAILGCVGERLCQASATVAKELRVPLIAPLSGGQQFGRNINPWVFRIRAGYGQEAVALAAQLHSIGATRVAVLREAGASAELDIAIVKALQGKGVAAKVVDLSEGGGAQSPDLAKVLSVFASGSFNAVVMNTHSDTVERAIRDGIDKRPEWPWVIVTTSSGPLYSLLGGFANRVVGFSAVVPNPETSQLAIARQLQADAEKYSNARAVTFDGMEGYIAARVLVRALRSATTGAQLAAALEATGGDVGGFVVSFARDRESGSNWVDVGIRSKDGRVLR